MIARTAAAFSAFAVAWLPEAALACAVCTGGGEESKSAFIVTTIGMSIAPLAIFGGIGWWIWRRSQRTSPAPQVTAPPEHTVRIRS